MRSARRLEGFGGAVEATLAHRYGSLPVQRTGRVTLVSSPAATVDGGTVVLVPTEPEPELEPSLDEGVHEGFEEFLFTWRGR